MHEREIRQVIASKQPIKGEVPFSSRMKGEFLSTLSYELRTPLHAILDWVQVLTRQNNADPAKGLILSNVVKFTPRGGRVQVLLERVNSHLELSVADSGQGDQSGAPAPRLRSI